MAVMASVSDAISSMGEGDCFAPFRGSQRQPVAVMASASDAISPMGEGDCFAPLRGLARTTENKD